MELHESNYVGGVYFKSIITDYCSESSLRNTLGPNYRLALTLGKCYDMQHVVVGALLLLALPFE